MELRRDMLKQPDYIKMPRKVSNQTLMILEQNWKSFFAALREYKKNPSKFTGRPKLPGYLDTKKGRFVVQFEKGAISSTALRNGKIKLSQTIINIPFINHGKEICLVRVVPKLDYYNIEIVYKTNDVVIQEDNGRYFGIDVGLNNLFTICSNIPDVAPVIVNGRDLKSMNQFWNKRKAYYQSKLQKGQHTSKKLQTLTSKRSNKIKDGLHKKTTAVIQYAIANQISKIVVGHNKGWKQEINIGGRNNQNFVNVPHQKGIEMLKYKATLAGITLVEREESYTSKCSFLDGETIQKHETYKGRRKKRGLFVSSSGRSINADLNGAYNILKKEIPNAFQSNRIEGVAVHPQRLAVGR